MEKNIQEQTVEEAVKKEGAQGAASTPISLHAPTNAEDCGIELHRNMNGYRGFNQRMWWVVGLLGIALGAALVWGIQRSQMAAESTTTLSTQMATSPAPEATLLDNLATHSNAVPLNSLRVPLRRERFVGSASSLSEAAQPGSYYASANPPSATQLGQNLQIGASTYGEYSAPNVNATTGVPNPYPNITPTSYVPQKRSTYRTFTGFSQPPAPGSMFGSTTASSIVVTQTTGSVSTSNATSTGTTTQTFDDSGATYAIWAGEIIPAQLDTKVVSDIPGVVIAHVTAAVYDSNTGTHVLIPAQSRILGQYGSTAQGQTRMGITWNVMVLPNGRQVSLSGLIASDTSGAAGLPARVDSHTGRVFRTTLLLGGLASMADLAQGRAESGVINPSVGSTIASAQAEQFVNTGSQMIQADRQVPPTLTVPEKTLLSIIVDHTLTLPDFRRMDGAQ